MGSQVDVLIIGGGLTGAALMLALQGLGWKTLLVDAHAFEPSHEAAFDVRSLALAPASVHILKTLGLWERLNPFATPINMIHVSQQHRFGITKLQNKEQTPLGYVVGLQIIKKLLHELIPEQQRLGLAKPIHFDPDTQSITLAVAGRPQTIEAKLIVAADGTDSALRSLCALPTKTKTYTQHGIATNIGISQPHRHIAYERFTKDGPMALLPLSCDKMSLVWAHHPERAKELMALDPTSFVHAVQHAFGYRLGKFTQIGSRTLYPLTQTMMTNPIKWPFVFIGNAAQTLHPVAGQGFNLGLRDSATLAQCIAEQGLEPAMLDEYLRLRTHDRTVISGFTDGLINLFSSHLPGLALARSAGFIALDLMAPLKNVLMRYAGGLGGHPPDLACTIALNNRVKT